MSQMACEEKVAVTVTLPTQTIIIFIIRIKVLGTVFLRVLYDVFVSGVWHEDLTVSQLQATASLPLLLFFRKRLNISLTIKINTRY